MIMTSQNDSTFIRALSKSQIILNWRTSTDAGQNLLQFNFKWIQLLVEFLASFWDASVLFVFVLISDWKSILTVASNES